MVSPDTPPTPGPPPRRGRRRNDRGLTTLEWLLIVAAVAGLAALAVVLVQNVVDDTAEQIADSSARLTAAEVAAAEITEDAKTEAYKESDSTKLVRVNSEAKQKCERLRITYGSALTDATKSATWKEDVDTDRGGEGCKIES